MFLGLGFGLTRQGGVASFSPAGLFSGAEDGAVYDVQSFSNLWQDAAGTTPVTAVGQTVQRVDDTSGNGNHASNASSTWTIEEDVFGNRYLATDGANMLTTGTVFASPAAWPSVAGAFHSPNVAGYPFSVGIVGADRHIALQQGTNANDRAGIWKRNAAGATLQTITGFYSGALSVVASFDGGTNTIKVNGLDQSGSDALTAPAAGNYAISLGGINDAAPNVEEVRFYGAMTIGRQLTADEITQLVEYYAAVSAVGDLQTRPVFLNIGQSNMIGRDTSDGTLHASKTAQWDPLAGDLAAASPLNHYDGGGSSGPDAGDIGMDVTFSIEAGGNIIFIPHASGGTSFTGSNWNQGDALYTAAVASANRFHSMYQNALSAILWHQGESDSGNAGYEAALDAFIADIRTDLSGASATTPFILGGLVPDFVAASGDNAAIQAIILDTPNRVSDTFVVSSDGLTDLGDNLHFSAASTKTIGERYYSMYAEGPSVPDQFGASDWSVASGNAQADVTISALPYNGGGGISDIEYQVDGGSWVSSGGITDFSITGLTNGVEYDISIRAVNAIGNGDASATKAVTPSAPLYGPNLWADADPATYSGYTVFQTNDVLTIGETYLVEFSHTGTGQISVRIGNPTISDALVSNTGTFSQQIVCDAGGDDIRLQGAGGAGFTGTASGISIREVL